MTVEEALYAGHTTGLSVIGIKRPGVIGLAVDHHVEVSPSAMVLSRGRRNRSCLPRSRRRVAYAVSGLEATTYNIARIHTSHMMLQKHLTRALHRDMRTEGWRDDRLARPISENIAFIEAMVISNKTGRGNTAGVQSLTFRRIRTEVFVEQRAVASCVPISMTFLLSIMSKSLPSVILEAVTC